MSLDLTFVLIVLATIASGLLAGASLDQSIKQLPARHQLGAVAFSQYSRASDLSRGIFFYGLLGVSAAGLNFAAAITTYFQGIGPAQATPIYLGALFALLHSLVTTQAAPINFSQRKVSATDEPALAAIFDKFARWQNIRSVLQVLNFGFNLWAIITYASVR